MRPITTIIFISALSAVPAGSAEISLQGPTAFQLAKAGLNSSQIADFNYGQGLFHHVWAATRHGDGTSSRLGPLYNANACAACHIADGRGHPPEPDERAASGFVLRLSAGTQMQDGYALSLPDPTYGAQLQDRAIDEILPEGHIKITYTQAIRKLAGGIEVALRQPTYTITDLAYGPLAFPINLGPRIAPPIIGLGLLESIPAQSIIAAQDPDDDNNDGISGRANWTFGTPDTPPKLGRFGWKATTASVRQQSDNAAATDMGLSNPRNSASAGDCTKAQTSCLAVSAAHPLGKTHELADSEAKLIAFYTANLRVPPRRGEETARAKSGKKLFTTLGCAACHTPNQTTTDGEQFSPYTDLLLHDMGLGLADGISIGFASPADWRTPPLWGLGRTFEISGHTLFLHDGRARNLTEAILWHGGEGAQSAREFADLPTAQRQNLLNFLNTL